MDEANPKTIRLEEYRVPPYLIDETELHVDLNEERTVVTTTLTMRRNPDSQEHSGDLTLNGGNLATRAIRIDDRELKDNEYGFGQESLTLYGVPDQFVLTTEVEIKPQDNTALEGLYKSGDMFCTQCEAEGFRNITWYLDRPDVMSIYRTTITADRQKYPVLLANGNKVANGDEGDRHWVTWEDPFRKPAYLFALVAGDLQFIEDEFVTMNGRNVVLRIFSERHNIDKVSHAMTSLKNAMAWDERVFGREYDLDIFMIVAVDSFNMGAMENKGLNIFNTSCVLARPDTTTDAAYQRVEGVVAHEYFHNWSGNRVTCRDWFQLSLKEGFTVFRDQQFSADMGSPTVCRVNDVSVLRSAQFPEDAGPMAHPVRPDSYIEINNFYTPTVYEKGAEVVRMIHTLLGPERFRHGSDLYFDRHDGQAATTEDFVRAMEDANDFDLLQFRRWYSQAGTPMLNVRGSFDKDENIFRLDVDQSCPPTPGQDHKEPLHLPLALGLLDQGGNDIRLETNAEDVASVSEGNEHYTAVLHVTDAKQTFIFTNVQEEPVPSLLRGFSAPVKLDYDYSRDSLLFLMSHDSDGFNRWEAGQRLAIAVMRDIMSAVQQDKPIEVDSRLIQACANILDQAVEHNRDGQVDKAMIAEMLVMPTETYLAELMDVADVDVIRKAREAVRAAIATELKEQLLSIYRLNDVEEEYEPTAEAIGRRALKNIALAYLMQPDDTDMVPVCVTQFEQADNMTDTSAALRALVNSAADEAQAAKQKALADFYNRWSDEALVVDQWFQVQATCQLPDALKRVKELMSHEAFTMKNPNRMRSLVVSFAFQNNVNFHQTSGEGYKFLADRVIELNSINPQMAARVLQPLTRWRKYDQQRQGLMKAQLDRVLATESLSPDVYEVASKSV
ncbi:MAG: aminopeptidase N [Pseudomonadales bacterium]